MTIPHVIEWHEGAPEKLEAGMLVEWGGVKVELVGHVNIRLSFDGIFPDWKDCVTRWAWAIKPHELTWASDMAKRQLAK